jgi:outer membrane immunogenic protein
MKKYISAILLAIPLLLVLSTAAHADQDVQKDFDSLGDNDALVERARAMDPHNSMDIVQQRLVDRNLRFEFGIGGGLVGGGDSFYDSETLNANLDFHINPHWSLGLRYARYYNQLTSEGQQTFNYAQSGVPGFQVPDLAFPVESGLAVVNWYPIYGKLGFVSSVAHFDLYLTAGYGKTSTQDAYYGLNYLSDTWTAGGGVGIWWTNHITSRLEVRYQTYQDQVSSGMRREDTATATASVGFLL